MESFDFFDATRYRINHQLNQIPKADDFLPGCDDPLFIPSALQAEVIFPWQPGFFPEEQTNETIDAANLARGETITDMQASSSLTNLGPTTSDNTQRQLAYLEKVQPMFNTGTTTLGFVYSQGIILATDSRATANGLIVSQALNKVIPVSSNILCTLAGNAADCVYWLRSLAKKCKSHEQKYGVRMPILHAANLLVNMVRKYRSSNIAAKSQTTVLTFGTLMGSYDEQGPQLYMIDNTGLLLSGTKFCVGSGSEHAQAILATEYRPDLTEAEAYQLATSAIYYACRRDIHSGGFVRLYKIDADGWRQVFCRDVKDIYTDMNGGVGGGDF